METKQRRTSTPFVLGTAGLIVVASLAFLTIDDWGIFVAFTFLIGASELFQVTLPNDVRYSLGLAPALGFAMLGSIDPVVSHPPLSETLTAFAAGAGIAMLIRRARGRPTGAADVAGHVIALAAGAALYYAIKPIHTTPGPLQHLFFNIEKADGSTDISVLGFAAMFASVLLIETLLTSLRRVEHDPVPFGPVFRGTASSTFSLHLSVLSVGALLAVAYPALRLWAFPLFLAPLGATQFAFRQFASIRRTYLQTIRALSKVPEMAGYTQPGHSSRVATLSVAVARELGIDEQEVNEIEYAALLHDIGRLSIPDPADATEAASSMELAVVGAAIVRETGHFPRVAEMIEHQHDPYRRKGEGPNDTLPSGAKIIKIASAYDDLTRPGSIGLSPSDVLDKLSLGMAFDYDPDALQALRRVLEKQNVV